jgi:hypothetical protein
LVALLVGLLANATPASASGGGGGGGTTVPPIQLAPDSPTLASGSSEYVQVLITPAAPAGGATLSITSSSASLIVPSSLVVGAGLANAQFPVTAASVAASTPVTMTVRLGTASASVGFTLTPAPVATLSGVDVFPRVVASGDPVTVNVGLTAPAPPGGATVALHSDSAALVLPATVFVPAGSGVAPIKTNVGAVPAVTMVTVTATLGGATVSGPFEIDPSRVLTGLAVGPTTTDGTKGATGGVSISVAADGNTYAVALQSSNPAVASVPASAGFLNGQSSTTFPVSTTAVTSATNVTISATAGGVTLTTTLSVVPTPPPPFDLQTVTVSPSVVAGAGTATATVTTTTGAPAGGVTVKLSSSDTKLVTVPATVFIPSGATSVTFPVKVIGQSSAVNVAIGATFQNRGRATILGVTSAKGGALLQATQTNQVLDPRPVNDIYPDVLGYAPGGTVAVESGQMPPGVSLISNLRPGEFDFHGSPQKAGTYTFVLKFTGAVVTPYTIPFVWVITAA